MVNLIFTFIKPFSDPKKEIAPLTIEMLRQRIKAIAQSSFVLICSDPNYPFFIGVPKTPEQVQFFPLIFLNLFFYVGLLV